MSRRGLFMTGGAGGVMTTPHDLTSNQGPHFILSASSRLGVGADGGSLAYYTMNGSHMAPYAFHTEYEDHPWWQIAFDRAVELLNIDFWWRGDDSWGLGGTDFILQYSDDGENFADVLPFSVEMAYDGPLTQIPVENAGRHRYWRITGDFGDYMIIGELELTYRR